MYIILKLAIKVAVSYYTKRLEAKLCHLSVNKFTSRFMLYKLKFIHMWLSFLAKI